MKKKIIAFGASNSIHSINKRLATYAGQQLENADLEVLDLNDYEMPIYSIDREKESGVPALGGQFKLKIQGSDGIIISFAEHNGAYTTAFKNILDWISRIDRDIWAGKPMLLLATSPGGRGGKSVLDLASKSIGRMNKGILTTFSLPSFHHNFSEEDGIHDTDLNDAFRTKLNEFRTAVWQE